MMQEIRFYKENNSKRCILVNGKLSENDTFTEIKANSVDAVLEKHVPVYEIDGHTIHVSVGSIEHPMSEEHYIMWIAQIYDNKVEIVNICPNEEPKATFQYVKGSVIYAYCNLHGLWKTIVE